MIRFKKKKLAGGILATFLALSLCFSQVAWAGRSAAGGGDMAEFDFGKWAAAQAIGFASSMIGSAFSSAMSPGPLDNPMFSSTLSAMGVTNPDLFLGSGFYGSFLSWAVNSNIDFAIGQLNSVFANSGLDPKISILASSVFGSILSGGLHGMFSGGVSAVDNWSIKLLSTPGAFSAFSTAMGNEMFRAAFADKFASQIFDGMMSGAFRGIASGAIEGVVEGAILASLVDDKGRLPFWAGPVANLAGGFVSGTAMQGSSDAGMSFLLRSLPATALSIGVNALTENMEPQDRQMVQAAFSGVYSIGGMAAKEAGFTTGVYNVAPGAIPHSWDIQRGVSVDIPSTRSWSVPTYQPLPGVITPKELRESLQTPSIGESN
jgi:hypothetical protein